jgi:hypothetical protein
MIATILLFKIAIVFALSTAEGSATLIAGVIAPMLAQLVKKLFGASGHGALAVTVVVAALVAIGAMYVAGEIHSVGDVVKQITAVFGIATIVYKMFALAETTPAPPVAASGL